MAKRRTPDASPSPGTPLVGKSAEVAAATKARVLEMLGRHPDIVDAETAATLAEREAGWAERGYVHERMQGYQNDQFSKGAGVTLLLTTKQKDELLQNFRKWGYPTLTPNARGKNLWAVRLPKGDYAAGFGGLSFHIEAGTYDTKTDQYVGRKDPFVLPYNHVVRIEGDGGELWQNVNYTPDGGKRKRD